MSGFSGRIVQITRIEMLVGLGAAAVLGAVVIVHRRFAAQAWPTVTARIENVFLEVASRGPNHRDVTQVILADGYQWGDSFYSGEVRLRQASLPSASGKLIGKRCFRALPPGEAGVILILGQGSARPVSHEGWSNLDLARALGTTLGCCAFAALLRARCG